MKTLVCEICGEEFEAASFRPHGDFCEICRGWLWALEKGRIQIRKPEYKHDSDRYEKLGMTIAYLVKRDELKEEDFIHGFIKGIRKT